MKVFGVVWTGGASVSPHSCLVLLAGQDRKKSMACSKGRLSAACYLRTEQVGTSARLWLFSLFFSMCYSPSDCSSSLVFCSVLLPCDLSFTLSHPAVAGMEVKGTVCELLCIFLVLSFRAGLSTDLRFRPAPKGYVCADGALQSTQFFTYLLAS